MKRITDPIFARSLFRDAVEEYPKHQWHEGYEVNPRFELLKITEDGQIIIGVEPESKQYYKGQEALHELYRVRVRDAQDQLYTIHWWKADGDEKLLYSFFCIGTDDFYKRLFEVWNKITSKRQYRGVLYDNRFLMADSTTMKKVWNRGLGCLEVWHIDHFAQEIIVNTCLFNYADRKYLREILEACPELKAYKVYGFAFGYPLYYNYGFTTRSFRSQYKPFEI